MKRNSTDTQSSSHNGKKAKLIDDNVVSTSTIPTTTRSADELPTAAEILGAISIPYMESSLKTTDTYRENNNRILSTHRLNVLSKLTPLQHIPIVVLSLIGEYCKRIHDTPWLKAKTLTVGRPARPSELAIARITCQSKLLAQVRAWTGYFQYIVHPPVLANVSLNIVVACYLRSRSLTPTWEINDDCWKMIEASADPECVAKLEWLRAQRVRDKEQHEKAKLHYQLIPPRWTTGYLEFADVRIVKKKKTTILDSNIDYKEFMKSTASDWKLLDYDKKLEWTQLSNYNNQRVLSKLQHWVCMMDQVESEMSEWPHCWSNPNRKATTKIITQTRKQSSND